MDSLGKPRNGYTYRLHQRGNRTGMARGKGESSIYKDKTKEIWRAAIELPPSIDGKRRRKVVSGKSKAEVLQKLRKEQKKLEENGDLITKSMTLSDWMTYWMDNIAPRKVRPKTLAGYRSVVDGYIIPIFGKKPLDKLTPAHVRELHRKMECTPKNSGLRTKKKSEWPEKTIMLSSTYVLLAHNTLSAALKAAYREGRITSNPCEKVDKPKKRVTNELALTTDEAIRMLQHCVIAPEGNLWSAYLLTGGRRGEIIGLEIDRVTDVLDLSWQLQRIQNIDLAPTDFEYRHLHSTLYLTRPKNSAGWRILPLVEPLRSIIKLEIGDRTEGLVFTNNGVPWDPDRVTKNWKKELAAAKLNPEIDLHGTRHTVVDLLFAAGVPEAIIMEIVGHSTRMVTRGYRSRGNREILKDAMERMSAMVASSTEPCSIEPPAA